jgi:CelD/BcsL family acetyltransferase involved in cellulose biosynthesis
MKVRHYELTDVNALSRDWQQLEPATEPTFFLSWQWIGTWIETYAKPLLVLEVKNAAGVVVGLGLLRQQRQRKFKLWSRNTLYLHQLGEQKLDQIWIEYNGVLCHREHQAAVEQAALHHLKQHLDWDEWVISGIAQKDLTRYQSELALPGFLRWSAPCYGVDIAQLRQKGAEYRQTLSANTRYQVNRTQRLYEQNGPLSIHRPTDVRQAVDYFAEIGPLHIKRWSGHKQNSGFLNAEFVSFHQNLITRHWPANIDLLKVCAGDQVVAIIYNFIHRKTICFYLGVFKADDDKKLKPGLLSHTLCIEQYQKAGFDYYDFMGGDEQYKAQLGVVHNQLRQFCFVRNQFAYLIELGMKKIKRVLFK